MTSVGLMLSNYFLQSTFVKEGAPFAATKCSQPETCFISAHWKLCAISLCNSRSMHVKALATMRRRGLREIGAGEAEMPRNIHLPVRSDFALANKYNTHSFP